MRALGARGGVASGETRRRKKVAKILELTEVPAKMIKRPNLWSATIPSVG